MTGEHHSQPARNRGEDPGGGTSRRAMPVTAWLIIGLAVLGIVIYLFIDHLPHLVAVLPYVAIIGMAAMHLFGHRHHGGSHHSGETRSGGSHHNGGSESSGAQDRS